MKIYANLYGTIILKNVSTWPVQWDTYCDM